MPRLLRVVLLLLLVIVVGAAGYGAWKNPEKGALTDADRSGVPGEFVASSHGTTHYDVAGPDSGRVVVLVHGFSVPFYIWDSTFVALSAAGYRTIRYDLVGRGWSDRPDVEYDGALFDAQLDELLDSLHVTQPVDLMGVSFGGFVTAHYVASHRARVRTLTLVDPVASPPVIPPMLSTPVLGPWVFQTMAVPGMADGQASDFLHPEQFPGWADRYRPQTRYDGFGRALLRTRIMMSHIGFGNLYAAAGQTGVPTLLIWGKQDQTVPIILSDTVRRNIPQADFFPVDSSGHLPQLEHAALVNDKILAFLAAHPGAP